jgi:hypothetical protein
MVYQTTNNSISLTGPTKNNVVCIAGMHRSGTSMVARLLNLCGLYLGPERELVPPDSWNEPGYWENFGFVQLNDDILSRLGTGWDLPALPPNGWEMLPEMIALRGRTAALIQQFSDHPLWGWKDPRNSITLPFWKLLIPNLKVVVCLRNPLEVAQSLTNRGLSSRAFGLGLWTQYYQQLLTLTTSHQRVITHYASYFHDARAELKRVVDALGMDASEEAIAGACQTVLPSFRNNRLSTHDVLNSGLPAEISRLNMDLCAEAGPVYQELLEKRAEMKEEPSGSSEPFLQKRAQTLGEVGHKGMEGYAQLFLQTSNGYDEAVSYRFKVAARQWMRLVFPVQLHDREAGIPLRLDPIDQKGILEIGDIELISEIDDSIIWKVGKASDFDSLVVAGTAIRLPDPYVLRIFCHGEDSQLYLPETAAGGEMGPLRLEIWLRYEPDPEYLTQVLTQLSFDFNRMEAMLQAGLKTQNEHGTGLPLGPQKEIAAFVQERLISLEVGKYVDSLEKHAGSLTAKLAQVDNERDTALQLQETRRWAETADYYAQSLAAKLAQVDNERDAALTQMQETRRWAETADDYALSLAAKLAQVENERDSALTQLQETRRWAETADEYAQSLAAKLAQVDNERDTALTQMQETRRWAETADEYAQSLAAKLAQVDNERDAALTQMQETRRWAETADEYAQSLAAKLAQVEIEKQAPFWGRFWSRLWDQPHP